jgi:hypothetical protein
MTVPTVSCTNCGKPFTTDDLRGTSCRYCGTLLAHHARAAQQAAVVNHMLADRNGSGIPDAYEGMIANAQANAMNQAFGMNPYPYGQPMAGPPIHHAAQVAHVQQVTAHVSRTISKVMIAVVVSVVLVTLLTIGLGVAFFLLAR